MKARAVGCQSSWTVLRQIGSTMSRRFLRGSREVSLKVLQAGIVAGGRYGRGQFSVRKLQ